MIWAIILSGEEYQMERYLVYLILFVVTAVIKFAHYFADAKREERGELSQHREYMGNLTDNNDLNYVEHLRSELEDIKYARETTENEIRNQYVFHDDGNGMDDVYAYQPKKDKME